MTRTLVTATLLLVCTFALLATCVREPGESVAQFEDRVRLPQAQAMTRPALDDVQRALEQELERLGEGFPGQLGIAVVEAGSGAAMGHNSTEPMPQQSVTKLWVAMTALDLVDKGALDLAEPVTIGREDLTLFYQPLRDIVRRDGRFATDYRDLMVRALTQSDNTANDRLLRRVGGPTAVEGFMRREGIVNVRFGTDERTKQSAIAGLEWSPRYSMGRAFYDARDKVPATIRRRAFEDYLSDPVDGASALGLADTLARLARGELLSEGSTRFLLATLEETKSGPRRLKGGLGEGWSIAHKTGTGQVYDGEQSGYNDVGVLTAPDGTRYAVAVLIGRTRSSYARRFELMQAVTQAVVDYHEGRIAGETA